jgi:hypothetical protein
LISETEDGGYEEISPIEDGSPIFLHWLYPGFGLLVKSKDSTSKGFIVSFTEDSVYHAAVKIHLDTKHFTTELNCFTISTYRVEC